MPSIARRPPRFHLWSLFSLGLALTGPSGLAGVVITLEQAYDRTLATDQSIRKAYWEIRKANLEPLSALTRLGPSIIGTGGLERNSVTTRAPGVIQTASTTPALLEAGQFQTVTVSETTLSGTGNLGISYQQTVLDLTALPAYRLGKLTAEAALLTYRSTVRQVLYSLAQAYYEVLKQQRILMVARQTEALARQQFDLANNRAAVGEVTRADVLRAQVTVESDRETVIEAENTLVSKRNILANVLNLPPETLLGVEEPPPFAAHAGDVQALLVRAIESREDLRVKKLAIDQDVQRRSEIKAGYAPKVVAQLDAAGNRISGSSSSRSNSWDAGLTVQVPFFTGGQREIDLAQAGYQISQTRLDYESFLKTVQQDVTDAWLQQRTLAATLEAVRVRVQSAQQAYEDLRIQYEAGTATSVDVLSALTDLNTARRDLTTQTYDYQVALRNLEEVTGTFQEERVRKLKFK